MSSLTRRGLFTAATAFSVSACASTPPAPTTTPTVGWTPDGLEIGLRIRRGELTAQEAVGEAIRRAQALQPQLNFIVNSDFDRAMSEAAAGPASRQGP